MIKTNYFFFLFALIVFFSCGKNKTTTPGDGPVLFPQPRVAKLDTVKGYAFNPITGDSIIPLINIFGDTSKTGDPIPTEGWTLDPDTLEAPNVVNLSKPTVLKTNQAVHPIPANLKTVQVNEKTFRKFDRQNDTSAHVIKNGLGISIPTGVPIKLKGKKMNGAQPVPVASLPLRMNENASYNIQSLGRYQGLNSAGVSSIMEDKRGELWFGSSSGASRYDGRRFLHYGKKEGLATYVSAIFEDSRGHIWFATKFSGITRYDGKQFTRYSEQEGLSANMVLSIYEDKKKNLWFGTNGGGAIKYDGKDFTFYTTNEGLCSNGILSVYEDRKGNTWFGSFNEGITKYDGRDYIYFTQTEGMYRDYYINDMLEDTAGNMWFATYNGGLTKYDGNSFTHFGTDEGLPDNSVWDLMKGSSGEIWVGTKNGAAKYDGVSFIHYGTEQGFSDNIISSICEDRSGNFWFGTSEGVEKYSPHGFYHFGKNEGLPDGIVSAAIEDNNHNLWFGTEGDGLLQYNNSYFSQYTQENGLPGSIVRTLAKDRDHNLWIGFDGRGVPTAKYSLGQGKNFTLYGKKQGLCADEAFSITQDPSGNMWFGSCGFGMAKYDGKTYTQFNENEGFSSPFVVAALCNKKGDMWMGTNGGGVIHYDGKNVMNITEKEGLPHNSVWSVYEDHAGNLWFGTEGGGACMFDGKDFVYYTEREGLASNMVWSIVEDRQGNMWVSTTKGISCIQKDKGKFRQIQTFLNNDGLKGIEFASNSVLLDSKNRLWWGSIRGLTMLDLDKFKLSDKIPSVFLDQVEIGGKFIDFHYAPDSLKKGIDFASALPFYNYPQDLKLDYKHNHLTFYFSAIDWKAPHKLMYQYKMEGLDDTWSKPSKENKADFRNLSYGTYTFKARSIGESQTWGKPFEYTFTIYPPWWHTWWFRTAMAIVFILLLYVLYRWRTSALRERQKQLEATVEERTAEVVEEKKVVEQQKHLIEEKHKEITDSINYAERIQRSFLATQQMMDENLPQHFVLFKPKDVVSGDFYWAAQTFENLNDLNVQTFKTPGHQTSNFFLAVADSTGHGVPGAIMSILNITCLENSVKEGLIQPKDILNHTRKNIIERLKKDGSAEGGKDGMDCALLSFDLKNNRLNFALANNPLWLIRNNELVEYSPDKMPVGKHDKDSVSFTQQEITLQKDDLIYIFTDGYPDQFGGPKGKKFKYKNLGELLLAHHQKDMQEQKEILATEFEKWRGDLEQVDDVCIIGIRI